MLTTLIYCCFAGFLMVSNCIICVFFQLNHCRKDRVEEFSVAAIEAKGGGGCILAERMLPEVAYKIDKAPKYGA
jgi:hypothetical protein